MKIPRIASAALILILAAAPVTALEPNSSCQALAAWAANLENLPTDYASFTALPSSHRRAVYPRLSAAERAGLWQRQWQEALQLPGWNAEQAALIAEASQVMDSGSFTAAKPIEAIRDLESRVAQAFPRADARELFYQLGPRDPRIEASAIKVCDCSLGGTNFCEVGDCRQVACLQPIDSCGFSWDFPCDGRCG